MPSPSDARRDRAADLAFELEGTVRDLEDVLDSSEIGDEDLVELIMEHVQICSGCGWWCYVEDMETDTNDEYHCLDCIES